MIILDTETTNLTAPEAAPIEQQPSIVEFAAIKLDDKTLKEKERLEFRCNPRVIIPAEATAIHGITNAMVSNAPPFKAFLQQLIDFFLGQKTMAAHNMSYDGLLMRYELLRIGKAYAFPWPPEQICTVEKSLGLKGHRLSLGELHKIAFGKEMTGAHRAMNDVEALADVFRWMRKKDLV